MPFCITSCLRSLVIDTRLKVDIPRGADNGVSATTILALCTRTLSTAHDWDVIIKKRLAGGAHMEPAWRLDTNLDWVWWVDDIHNNPRSWAVLAGLALNRVLSMGSNHFLPLDTVAPGRTPRSHMAPPLHIEDGDLMSGPPSVDGYVTRVRFASGPGRSLPHCIMASISRAWCHCCPLIRTEIPEVRRGAEQVLAARDVTDL
jgi:hypothetical protein